VPEELRSGAPLNLQPGPLWPPKATPFDGPDRAGAAQATTGSSENDLAGATGASSGIVENDPTGALATLEVVAADPWDVAVLVEQGVADAGVAPKHVLAETRVDVFEVLDLRVGVERLVYAAPEPAPTPRGRRLLLATTHPHLTQAHFARAGVQVEMLALRSAAELAAALLAVDGAVLPLAPGETRTAAGLAVRDEVARSSARLVVNRSARVVRAVEIGVLVEGLRTAVRLRAADPPGASLHARLVWRVDSCDEESCAAGSR
jgi:ATP phosphoribosyltransferase